MPRYRLVRCILYGVIALVGLVVTQTQLLTYVHSPANFIPGVGAFFVDTTENPASRSVTVDLFLFYLAAVIFMVAEARKHRIRFVWAYIIVGYVIAACVALPLFLIARERALASESTDLHAIDALLLTTPTLLTAGLTAWLLTA